MTTVRLIHRASVEDLIAVSIAFLEPLDAAVLAVSGSTPRSIEAALVSNLPISERTQVVRPGTLMGSFGRRLRPSDSFAEIDVSDRAARLTTVSLPSALRNGNPVLAVNDLRALTDPRPEVAIGLWSSFVSPWQRIGARASDPRDGLVAEIALAAPGANYLVIDRIAGELVGVTGADMIAVELVVLALRWAGRGLGADTGPWEDPLIQHATDLQLGVTIPGEIAIEALEIESESLLRIIARAAGRIGVTRFVPS